MNSELFRGPRLKIERAKQHINYLESRMSIIHTAGFRAVSIKTDMDTGNDTVQVRITKSVPDDFPLVLGDILHNLKSALDITVNEIVFSILGFRDDYTRFPFRETRYELVAATKGGKISQASPAVADYIVNVIKPYDGGNTPLWALHRLNIEDKHRLLIPTFQLNLVDGIRYENDRGEQGNIGSWAITRKHASHNTALKNVKIVDEGDSALYVMFEQGLPYSNVPVFQVLHTLMEATSSAIEGIESVFFDRK